MISKIVISILLLSGTLQILALDNYDRTLEIKKSHRFQNEEIKQIESYETKEEKKFQDPALQLQKDYNHWGEKSNKKSKCNKFTGCSDHMKYNEIDSNEYIDKYNKYGKTFNPNLIKAQKYKMYQQKRASDKEKLDAEHEKAGTLLHDLNVNYINNNKEISGDSELILEKGHEKAPDLLHDINVNNNNKKNNKKEISGDSELIVENKERKNKEDYQENYQNKNEIYMKRFKKDFMQSLSKIDLTNPPPANETVLMARYIMHTVDWAALATVSVRASTKGAPFVCVLATSDGMKNESSGIPFFYMTPMDLCSQDLQKDNRVSILVTLSQTTYCKDQNFDPQDPRCAKLTLSGKIKKIKPGSDEEKFARNALFSRHPVMKSWPADHNWYFTKLKIGQIVLLDRFGGATYIKVKDYFNGKVAQPELKRK